MAQRPESRLLVFLPLLAIVFSGQPEPGGIAGPPSAPRPPSPPVAHGSTAHGGVFQGREVDQATTPPVTILYQNFPNPFPDPDVGGGETRIWFDLARRSRVELAVFDVRGRLVRHLIPARGCSPQELPAGVYGRGEGPSGHPCVRLTWDGRDEEGRTVPRGVFLLRLVADGTVDVRRMVFWP